ncbi:hypothetical protein AEQ67_10775 [Pseudomonas sp. RIT-PI-q]|uniref:hypothetical protein n=1 Tax=Pseudomonas sp. RIT-PI-q TaxID=1690247 RepID=UPI0006CC69A7|nr:hypothetical protein [Pseudomonas sp. RIT-PI-q]KPG99608.1 hypothetical protein AEQ67_10775 [Pseudomonas sp. RIT-PI-q]
MKRAIQRLALGTCLSLIVGCAAVGKPDTFTFIPDFPPDFTYELKAVYLPAKGQTCTLAGGRNAQLGFNKIGMKYETTSEIELYRTVENCPVALNLLEVKIVGVIGRDSKRSYTTYEFISIAVRHELLEKYKGDFNSEGEGSFSGQCQWLFRTVGPKRYITKILDCKKTDTQGNVIRGRPFTAYTLDQLPGKTVRLKITLAEVERPAIGDTWIKVPGGWKRCMGDNFEDQYAFCYGNHKDFSTFKMLDERICTIYPGCTENKEETHEH